MSDATGVELRGNVVITLSLRPGSVLDVPGKPEPCLSGGKARATTPFWAHGD